jgi:hypothetical protein
MTIDLISITNFLLSFIYILLQYDNSTRLLLLLNSFLKDCLAFFITSDFQLSNEKYVTQLCSIFFSFFL